MIQNTSSRHNQGYPIALSTQVVRQISHLDNSRGGHSVESPSQQIHLILPLIELLKHQQTLQKDTAEMISKLSDLWLQHKNDHFLADLI